MKYLILAISTSLLMLSCKPSVQSPASIFANQQKIVSLDINNFYDAFDKIQTSTDTLQQVEYLQTLFLDKASAGQKKMIEVRNHSLEGYLADIKSKPKFWNSLRKNTADLKSFNKELREGVEKLHKVYPELSPSTIYYTIGAHRSPGTGVDSFALIGAEFALGDSTIFSAELLEHHQDYYKLNPVDHFQFLSVHEYVHTQQKPMVHNLLSLTLYEGIGDFIAEVVTDHRSPFKSTQYGPQHEEKIKVRFEEDMFKGNAIYSWIWNSPNNEFGTSDLGYYVGHKIAALFYENANDKKAAIKSLIELDYSNEPEVEALVNSTKYFSKPLHELEADYEAKKPTVVKIEGLTNLSQSVSSNVKRITVHFSEPMNKESRGFDYGPLGESNVLRVQKVIGYSDDAMSFTFEFELESNKRYQSQVSPNFRSASGMRLKPFLIDFKTK